MKHADPEEIRALVEGVVRESPLAAGLQGVAVEADEFRDGSGEFLRIQLTIQNVEKLATDRLQAVVTSIERTLRERDDRFPSVRFSEP